MGTKKNQIIKSGDLKKKSSIWAIESLRVHFIFGFSIFNFSFWRNLASKQNGCDFRQRLRFLPHSEISRVALQRTQINRAQGRRLPHNKLSPSSLFFSISSKWLPPRQGVWRACQCSILCLREALHSVVEVSVSFLLGYCTRTEVGD